MLKASHIAAISCFVAFACTALPAPAAESIVVRSSAEFLEALATKPAPREIRLLKGEYIVNLPIVLPDGVGLLGEGVMQFDGDGLPRGFVPGTESVLRASAELAGTLLTLGDGTSLRGLKLVDRPQGPAGSPGRAGNMVLVASRTPRDSLSATIRECEIVNSSRLGVTEDGPSGHALVVLTKNPAGQAPPAPHEFSSVSVRMQRSIIRAPALGGGVFANNFAAHGKVRLRLAGNRIEGLLSVTGGASRPDAVHGALATVESSRNLYALAGGGFDAFGWQINGSSSAHIPGLMAPGPTFNTARVRSKGDRIEGFRIGIFVAGARRYLGSSGPTSDNRVDLRLDGTSIRSRGPDAADLSLQAAFAEPDPVVGREFAVGDRNVLSVEMHRVSGSGRRANAFSHVSGPVRAENVGTGNRLVIHGRPQGFARANSRIDPAPGAGYFAGAGD